MGIVAQDRLMSFLYTKAGGFEHPVKDDARYRLEAESPSALIIILDLDVYWPSKKARL